VTAWGISTLVLWGWHAPLAYNAALDDERIHALEHLSFLAAYVVYWWPLLGPGAADRSNVFRAAYLLAGATTSGLLGALMTFAPTLWYAHYVTTASTARLSPLADQHLAGAVMWLLGVVPFALVGVILLQDDG
jgi:putative membrane protein